MNVSESHTRHEAIKARTALRAARRSLHALSDCLDATRRDESFDVSVLRQTETILECYCELTLAVKSTCSVKQQTSASSELTRLIALQHLAGRRDEDLACAARCLLRNNERKLHDHAELARAALLRECARLQNAFTNLMSSCATHETLDLPDFAHERWVCEALLDFYIHIIELASQLDDRFTAIEISRFRDAECARLRRISVSGEFVAVGKDSRDSSHHALKNIARY